MGVTDVDPRRWKALATVLVASFMVLLDISIVNVAIPSIRSSINASFSEIEWVLAGYQLSYAVTLITGGRLGDIFGRKRLFMLGVTGFTLASAACGFAQSGGMLVTSRIIQGFMAALMYPQVLSVIQISFPPRERSKAFGILGGVIGVATITGPLAGGLLIQGNLLGLSWRPVFLVNVPIGIGAVLAAWFVLHESRSSAAPRLDIPGTIIATAALFLLAYPLVEGRDAGWPIWAFAMMAAGVIALAGFGYYNSWRDRTQGSALVEPALFTDRAFVVGLAVTGVFISGIPAFFLTFSLFLQIGHGFTALETGVTTIPFAVCSALGSTLSIRLAPRLGKRLLLIGTTLLTAGMVGVLFTLVGIGEGQFWGFALIPALAVAGLGLGCVVAPLVNIILAGIHHGHAGSASGVLTTVQQIGGAIGVTVIGVIFFGLLTSHAPDLGTARSAGFRAQLVARGLPLSTAQDIDYRVTRCFDERALATDPSANPPDCIPPPGAPTSGPVAAAIQSELSSRLAANFSYAFERAILYNLAVGAATFLLVLLLPNPEPATAPSRA